MVGLGFKKGDVPAYAVTNATSSQVIPKRTWNDGSLKHAIICGTQTLTKDVPTTITVSTSASAPTGTALVAADIATAAPSASFQAGSIGTVNLSSLLASPFRTWISGPQMVECHYRANVGSDTTLRVWFYVRLWASGLMWVRVVPTSGYLNILPLGDQDSSDQDRSYVPTIIIGGTTVYDNGAGALTHYAHTRYSAEGWIGTPDPQITPKHETRYLISTKLVPNYWKFGPDSSTLDALYQDYAYGQNGNMEVDMHAAGDNPMIALLPRWDALYINSDGDARAYRSVIANAKALNSYPIVWWDSSTHLPARPSDRTNWSVYGPSGNGNDWWPAGSLIFENAHHPNVSYLAYLLTGDYYFLETLESYVSTLYFFNNPSLGSGTSRIMGGQTRGVAWQNRSIGVLAGIGPDSDTIVDDFKNLLAFQATYWKSVLDAAGANQTGYIFSYEIETTWTFVGAASPWMQNFWVMSYGFISDLEPLASMTTWNAVRDHLYKSIVGFLGASSSTGYCYTRASNYAVGVSPTTSPDITTWGPTWAEIWDRTRVDPELGFPDDPCGSTLLGSSGGLPALASQGYWGITLSAISYAVDHGATGASAAYARMTGATNWSDVENSTASTPTGFNNDPKWGIIPRTAAPSSSGTLGLFLR